MDDPFELAVYLDRAALVFSFDRLDSAGSRPSPPLSHRRCRWMDLLRRPTTNRPCARYHICSQCGVRCCRHATIPEIEVTCTVVTITLIKHP